MKSVFKTVCLLLFVAWLNPSLAQETLSYQGSLLDANRQPVSASFPMVFNLYTQRDGGVAIWTERYDSVDVIDGAFTVELGGQSPFGADLANPSLHLGVSSMGRRRCCPNEGVECHAVRWAPMPPMFGKKIIPPA